MAWFLSSKIPVSIWTFFNIFITPKMFETAFQPFGLKLWCNEAIVLLCVGMWISQPARSYFSNSLNVISWRRTAPAVRIVRTIFPTESNLCYEWMNEFAQRRVNSSDHCHGRSLLQFYTSKYAHFSYAPIGFLCTLQHQNVAQYFQVHFLLTELYVI